MLCFRCRIRKGEFLEGRGFRTGSEKVRPLEREVERACHVHFLSFTQSFFGMSAYGSHLDQPTCPRFAEPIRKYYFGLLHEPVEL